MLIMWDLISKIMIGLFFSFGVACLFKLLMAFILNMNILYLTLCIYVSYEIFMNQEKISQFIIMLETQVLDTLDKIKSYFKM